ncbi:MAG: VWA domain-containing protein [Myxococcales bacterium]|nr:VWA domain-containing protein [Myxococcales bacterium]
MRWISLVFVFSLLMGFISPSQAEACEPPNVLLVLDVSGSMNNTTTPTRHTIVRNAIKTFTSNFNNKINFGLATFGEYYNLRIGVAPGAGATIAAQVDSFPSNENYTMMGTALYNAGTYLNGLRQAEPASTKDRPYYIVLITDGNPTGDTRDPAAEALAVWSNYKIKTYVIGIQFNAAVLNSVAQNGQTGLPYDANNQTQLTNAFNQIANNATAEICDNKDNDCDGSVDENVIRACGTACGFGQEVCSFGSWSGCTAPKPQTEVCDNQDNDCDGKVDETWSSQVGRSCSVGKGACQRTGLYVCKGDGSGVLCTAQAAPPQTEVCDGIDNDCDGKVDEDWPNKGQSCSAGSGACNRTGQYICKPDRSGVQCSVSAQPPSPEVCDGLDNDCNGLIDDGLARGCNTACGQGIETCTAGQWGGCTARSPEPEKCNGQDDNCDGSVDESLTRTCSTKCGSGTESCINGRWVNCDAKTPKNEECNGVDDDCNGSIDDIPPKPCQGACGDGVAQCKNGQWSGCSGPQPQAEVCDGKDNDCDGNIDEKVTRACSSPCGSGTETCNNGTFEGCTAPITQPELCDGKDNDCDGQADESAPCPTGSQCVAGACRNPCRNGECAQGLQCVDGVCMGNACAGVKCSPNEQCLAGRCVNLCTLVQCPNGLLCSRGQCVQRDCYIIGCLLGKRCVDSACEDDPCYGKTCPNDHFCREGACIPSCEGVVCNQGERCVDGGCQNDPGKSGLCQNVQCNNGQLCEDGKCVVDPCAAVSCAVGRRCVNGACVHDPCHNIKCPAGQTCVDSQCGESTTKGAEKAPEVTIEPAAEVVQTEPIVVEKTGGADGGEKESGVGRARGCVCDAGTSSPFESTLFLLLLLAFGIAARRSRLPL